MGGIGVGEAGRRDTRWADLERMGSRLAIAYQLESPCPGDCIVGQGKPPVPPIKVGCGIGCLCPCLPNGAIGLFYGISGDHPRYPIAEIASKIYFLPGAKVVGGIDRFWWALGHSRVGVVRHNLQNTRIAMGQLALPPRLSPKVVARAAPRVNDCTV